MKIEIVNEKLVTLGIESIIDFYKTMAIDHLDFPDLNVFATGVNSSALNVVIDTRNNEVDSSEINSITNFFNKYHVPWSWFFISSFDENNIKKPRFEYLYQTPGMYFDLSNSLPSVTKNIIIKEMKDDLKEWIKPLLEGFPSEDSQNDDSYRKLNAKLLRDGENKLRHFTAYFNEESACSGTLFLSDNSVMLHNLATKNKFKKLGFGTALTIYMMNQAKKLGYKHCFLDSSDEGFKLYSRVGFKVYCVTLVYKKSF